MRENGPVIYQKIDTPKGRIVKILLNRPDHGNRIDGEMWHDFMEAVDMASADREARVVISAAWVTISAVALIREIRPCRLTQTRMA